MCAITKVHWIPCLLLEGEPTPCGITTSYKERLSGFYLTSHEAMQAAKAAFAKRPDAIGFCAVHREV